MTTTTTSTNDTVPTWARNAMRAWNGQPLLADPEMGVTGDPQPTNGVDRCPCGCKYWTAGRCADCGDRYHR